MGISASVNYKSYHANIIEKKIKEETDQSETQTQSTWSSNNSRVKYRRDYGAYPVGRIKYKKK